jgi:hypothetical protein
MAAAGQVLVTTNAPLRRRVIQALVLITARRARTSYGDDDWRRYPPRP